MDHAKGILVCPIEILKLIAQLVEDAKWLIHLTSTCQTLRQTDCLTLPNKFILHHKFTLGTNAANELTKLTQLVDLSMRLEPDEETVFALLQLSTLTNLRKLMIHTRELNIDGLESLFKNLSNIEDLDLLGAQSPTNVWKALSYLPNLRFLTLAKGAEVLEPIRALTNLERLVVSNTHVKSSAQFDHLCRLPKLTHLGWKYAGRITTSSFRAITNLTNLEALVFDGMSTPGWNGEYNTSPLEIIGDSLTKLKSLVWDYKICEMELPNSMLNLKDLRLFHSTANDATLYDIGLLSNLPNLENLEIRVASKEAAAEVLKLKNLQRLSLFGPHEFTEQQVREAIPNIQQVSLHQ
jgi:hypothetical protein